uniref:Proteasome subunit beta n=1 Tax=Sus scrofa TaxID=9823 RepID=A0A4X1UH55_PIG
MQKIALEPLGGFSFENCQRNASLERALPGFRVPHALKTGTTIAGLVFQDGVILGADTRATNDSVVADKSCEKIHFIAPKIYCCGAGVAADAEMTTRMAASNIELHALSTGREPRVATVTRMLRQKLFRYQGHVGASLIVGGIDFTGPQLYSVHPHGSYSRLPFTALGSGQDAALAVLEDRFQPNMTVSDICAPLGIALVGSALGSWGNTEVPWPNPEVRKSFSEVMTEYRRRSQWSEGGEVQFQQTTVNAKAWTAWRGQNSERTI